MNNEQIASPLRGRKIPWYGMIDVIKNPEAVSIWRTRDDEPEFCEQIELTDDDFVCGVQHLEDLEFFDKLWAASTKILTEREQEVFKLRFKEDLTLRRVGELLGVSTERIRQIQCKALRRMKMLMCRSNFGAPYLSIRPRPPACHPGFAWNEKL